MLWNSVLNGAKGRKLLLRYDYYSKSNKVFRVRYKINALIVIQEVTGLQKFISHICYKEILQSLFFKNSSILFFYEISAVGLFPRYELNRVNTGRKPGYINFGVEFIWVWSKCFHVNFFSIHTQYPH